MTSSGAGWGHASEIEDVSGQVAIVGVGDAIYRRASGLTAIEIAVEATQRALDDAGLEPDQIDGIMSNRGWRLGRDGTSRLGILSVGEGGGRGEGG